MGLPKIAGIALTALVSGLAVVAALAAGIDQCALDVLRGARREFDAMRLGRSLPAAACPASALTIVALGQSNAGNHLGARVGRDPALQAFVFFRGSCAPIEDPLPGATGVDGSLRTMLAQRRARERGKPVVVIAGASVRDWIEDCGGVFSLLRSIFAAQEAGFSPDVALWLQGETDAENGMTGAVYETLLTDIINRFNAAVEAAPRAGRRPTWIVFQTSRCWSFAKEEIRAAQRAVAAKLPGVFAGPDSDALGLSYRRDGCHFNDAGRECILAELAPVLAAVAP